MSKSKLTQDSEIDGFFRLPQVLALIPISKSTWWKWVREGKAPQGTKIGPRITVWRESEIKGLVVDLQN